MTDRLAGVRSKIARSEYFIDQLNLALKAALSTTSVELRSKHRDAEGNHVVLVDIRPSEPPPGISLNVGDAVHNLRSALDHLVCQLAIAAGHGSACSHTQFPVFRNDSAKNRTTIGRRLNGLTPAARAEIEALQPYKRTPLAPESDPLWMLSELDNVDKHRILVVVYPRFAEMEITVTVDDESVTYPVSNHLGWRPLELGALPMRLTIPNDPTKPQTQVQVQARPLTGIVFAQTGLTCDGCEVAPLLRRLVADVRDVVAIFDRKRML